MTTLVIAEHAGPRLKASTLNAVAAAKKLGGPIEVLVAGSGCGEAAAAAARVDGVTKVRVADAPQYADEGAENLAALVASIAPAYSHVLAPATSLGKNVMPRVAVALDVAQASEVVAIVD